MLNEEKTETSPADVALGLAIRVAQGARFPARDVVPHRPELEQSLERLPAARLRAYLEELLMGPAADVALQWLHDTGLLARILPEVEATVNFTQEMGRRHKDVWKHTKQVVMQSVADPVVRWAALLHDVGKVPTRCVTPGGKVTFHGHADLGARMFDRIARRLAFPAEVRAQVRFLVLHHLRANQYDGSWTDSAVRRFAREMGPHLGRLLDLSRADITSARRHKRELALGQIDELVQRIDALHELDNRLPPLPSGIGNVIMERFGLLPGPEVGRIKASLERAVEAGDLEPHQDCEYYMVYLDHRLAGGKVLERG